MPNRINFSIRATRTCVVTVTAGVFGEIPAAEWTEHCQLLETMTREVAGSALAANLGFTDGQGPNARQRKQVAEVAKLGKHHASIVTANPLVRGVLTATAWLGVSINAFKPDQWQAAIARLMITDPVDVRRIAEAALECEAQLISPVRSLDPLRHALSGRKLA